MSKLDGGDYRRKLTELAGRLQDFQISKISRSRKSCGSSIASSPTPSEMSQYGFSKAQSVASLPSSGTLRKTKKDRLVEPERMKELETVEAQMANIAQSLSQKRRRQSSILSKNSKEVMKEVHDIKKLLDSREFVKGSSRGGSLCDMSNWKPPPGSDESEEGEKALILQHLARSQLETEQRRLAIKAIRMALESLEYSNRSSSKMEAAKADLQYQLDNEEMTLKCLKDEQVALLQLMNDVQTEPNPPVNLSIYRYIKDDPEAYQIRNSQFVFNPTKPCVRFEVDESGRGVYVNTAEEGTRLAKEDRILEINSSYAFGSTLEEVLTMVIPGLNHVTVLRKVSKDADYQTELRSLQEKCNAMQREREALKQENLKQSHRITYLEDQVTEMENACAELRAAGEIIHAETENLLKQIRGEGEKPEAEKEKKQKKPKPPRTSLLRKGDGSDTSSIKSDPKSDSSKSDEIPPNARYDYQQPELTASDFIVHQSKRSDKFKSRGLDTFSGRHIHQHEALYASTDIMRSRCETPSDNRSVASADNYREKYTVSMGYSSDLDRTIPRDKKKTKPPVPRKPSFLGKSSSLQSVERRQEEFINGYEMNPSGFDSISSARSEKSSVISLPSFKWPLLGGKKILSVH